MKNLFRLSAIAALAAAASVPAMAQSRDSVTLYGRADLNITKITGERLRMDRASNSRWGVRGVESVGGLRFSFNYESRVDLETGAAGTGGALFDRQSWLGVQGSMGTLRLGRSLSPIQRIASGYDPHGTDGIGSWGSTDLILNHGNNVTTYMPNALYYETPNMGGFSFFGAHTIDESDNNVDNSVSAVRLRYAQGPLDASLGFGSVSTGNKITSIGASYKIGSFTPMFQMAKGKTAGRDSDSALIGALVSVGKGEMRLAYSTLDDVNAANTDETLLAVGYDHPLSKRTLMYGTVIRQTEKKPASSISKTGFELGLRHNF